MPTHSELRAILSSFYDLGPVQEIQQIPLGYVNTSYRVEALKGNRIEQFILRAYRPDIRPEEIEFEHAVLRHLTCKNFPFSAGPVLTKNGESYVTAHEEKRETRYYALFDYLPGEDKYTWDNPACRDAELKHAVQVLAQYHDAVYDFIPRGYRSEPAILEFLPEVARNVTRHANEIGKTAFDAYVRNHAKAIRKHVSDTLDEIDARVYRGVVHLVIHGDYHPGNLKFQNHRVTGLFDFDWSRIEARCFDVALAMIYFCSVWSGKQRGTLELHKARTFLRAYQNAWRQTDGLGAMTATELRLLWPMLKAATLYVLHWTIEDYYRKPIDPETYLVYFRHALRLMTWLENVGSRQLMSDMIASVSGLSQP